MTIEIQGTTLPSKRFSLSCLMKERIGIIWTLCLPFSHIGQGYLVLGFFAHLNGKVGIRKSLLQKNQMPLHIRKPPLRKVIQN